jgi:phosphoribosylformimino-5-aminoimidazole carboxamide ribotide isomerase
MIVYAAIDLRGGRVVQLVGGRTHDERISWPDPLGVARRWIDAGFRALHVVDLDAAFETGSNRAAVATIIENSEVPVQVCGGVRDETRVADFLDAGAARVVVGTRALEDAAWRARMADGYPGRIVVAADVRDGVVVTRGWTQSTALDGAAFVASLRDEPLAAVLVTDVSREGSLQGVDIERFEMMVQASAHPVIAAGGIRDLDDLRALADAGIVGAVLGMSLYTGSIQPDDVRREFDNE